MLSSSRFADPFLDTPLVPEDFAAVSRFCAGAMNPVLMRPSALNCPASPKMNFECWSFFADDSAEESGQLQFDNI